MKQIIKQENKTFPILFQIRGISTQKNQIINFTQNIQSLEFKNSKFELSDTFLFPLPEISIQEIINQKYPNVSEIQIHEIPKYLIKEYSGLFPKLKDLENLKHITICQRTENDMTFWNSKVEVERDELAKKMIDIGTFITKNIQLQGQYFADFIDPTSGSPFKTTNSSMCLFENDESYIHFGFKIQDLSCCKVISHKVWGTNVFVGSLFTTAPLDIIQKAISPFQK